jgi:hypothetical protein
MWNTDSLMNNKIFRVIEIWNLVIGVRKQVIAVV